MLSAVSLWVSAGEYPAGGLRAVLLGGDLRCDAVGVTLVWSLEFGIRVQDVVDSSGPCTSGGWFVLSPNLFETILDRSRGYCSPRLAQKYGWTHGRIVASLGVASLGVVDPCRQCGLADFCPQIWPNVLY